MIQTPKTRVMIVEDEWAIAEDLSQSLKTLDYEVASIETTGEGAIRGAEENRPDLVLIDIILKEDMNGIDAAEHIHNKFNIPHIFITAYSDKEMLEKAKITEPFGYLIKPYDKQELKAAIEMALYKHMIESKLHQRQSELSTLYKVSSAISQTIDMDKLFQVILDTLTDIQVLNVQHNGGIFIIEDDRMKLAAHLGHSKKFLGLHKNMRIGDCLCGQAAQTGEIIISMDSCSDTRHTIQYPGMEPHGHIIIPFRSGDRIIGVVFLYIHTSTVIEKPTINLLNAISNLLGVAVENARLYEETKKFSLHDHLTGLANRRYMDIVLKRTLAQSRRFKEQLSIIMLDIDYFKKYNDQYGHTAGDNLLVKIATITLKETREIDLVVRYGGEEFLILLPETDITAAHEVAERIRTAVEAKTSVTISLGISSFQRKVEDEKELIESADKALYQAKEKGRNCIVVSYRRLKSEG